MSETPRRNRIYLFTPAEKAIWDAHQVVEALPPDERLTRAGNLLSDARDLVADYVDGIPFGEGFPESAPAALRPHSVPGWWQVWGDGICLALLTPDDVSALSKGGDK